MHSTFPPVTKDEMTAQWSIFLTYLPIESDGTSQKEIPREIRNECWELWDTEEAAGLGLPI